MDEYQSELNALKILLSQTDYVPNKLIEGLIETLSGATPVTLLTDLAAYIKSAGAEYGEVIWSRAGFRQRINELEDLMEKAEDAERSDA